MTAQQLRDKFEHDLAELQANCKHEEQEGMEEHWAPGHVSGYVWVCKFCEKVLKRENYK